MPRAAKNKEAAELHKALNPSDTPEKFKMGEVGYVGTKIFDGVSQEEIQRELMPPYANITYKQMSYHPTVASALRVHEVMLSKIQWEVKPPEKATEEELRRTEFIRECMNDMEHSWLEFVEEAASAFTYGYSLAEKVYRKRNANSGSKYSDNLIGWKKLPSRSQSSVTKFLFDDSGRDLIGVQQNLSLIQDPYQRYTRTGQNTTEINIPKSKLLHFRVGKHHGDPYGRSMLRGCYFAWKYLTKIEEIEAVGVARDLAGIPVLGIPPEYMSEGADPAKKAVYEYYKSMMRNLQMNQQSGIILPQVFDEATRQPLFKLELLKVEGGKAFDTTAIKDYYKNLIFSSCFADILIMGSGGNTGSYALGSLKQNLLGASVESFLEEIRNVLNHDLIKQTFELNGWDVKRLPTFEYDNLEAVDTEALSKYFQRVASVGLLEIDRETLNFVRESIGIDPKPQDEEPDWENMTGNTSRSGDGMAKGSGNGTSDNVAGTDNSANNLDNAA